MAEKEVEKNGFARVVGLLNEANRILESIGKNEGGTANQNGTANSASAVVNTGSNVETSSSTSSSNNRAMANFRTLFGRYGSGSRISAAYGPAPKRSKKTAGLTYTVKETWTHEFFCLSDRFQDVQPTRAEKAALQGAGLGRRRIVFNRHDDPSKFIAQIENTFPKLKSKGGFELLRSGATPKQLNPIIPPPSGYSVPFLRDMAGVGQAVIYIRPLQCQLTMDVVTPTFEGTTTSSKAPEVDCIICGMTITVTKVKEHQKNCQGTTATNNNNDITSPSPGHEKYNKDDQESSDSDSDLLTSCFHTSGTAESAGASSKVTGIIDTLKDIFPETPDCRLVAVAQTSSSLTEAIDSIFESVTKEEEMNSASGSSSSSLTIKDILSSVAKPSERKTVRLRVNRYCLVEDSIAFFKNRDFKHGSLIRISFEGEPAVDAGGLTREFFTLLLRELISPSSPIRLFEGKQGHYLPLHNTDALRSNMFKVAGRIIASSLLNGCSGFPFFPSAIYSYFINSDPDMITDITKEDVVDYEILEAISKLDDLKEDDLPEVRNEIQSLLVESGFPHSLSMQNRHQAAFSLCLQSVILSRKAELDQFLSGLGPVVESLRKYPEVMKPCFVESHEAKPPTAREFMDLIIFENVDPQQQEHFQQYLVTEESKIGDLLMFCTGCESIPPMGFFSPSKITVLENNSSLPNANTCPLELELPGSVKSFEEFREAMNMALEHQKNGFGII